MAFLGAANLWTLTTPEVQRNILDSTHQDGPFDLLAQSINLTSCWTDSTAVYDELKSMVMRLALDTIHNTLFMVLVRGYSIEPHNVLNHIWQSYANAEGRTVQLSTHVDYSTFLNTIHSFYDEEYPIDLPRILQDHIDLALQKSFSSH
jgi:hypothetical protein